MGLLDVLTSPEAQFAAGLLGGGDFGTQLARGQAAVANAQEHAVKQRLMQAQMDNFQSEVAQRAAAMQKQALMQSMIQNDLMGTGFSGSGLTQPPSGDGYGLKFGASNPQFSPIPSNVNPGGLASMTPEKLALYKLNGVDLTDVYKLTRPNLTNVNGTLVDSTDPSNINRYVPDPDKGKGFDPKTNRVSILPGFLDAQSAIEGGKADAQEAAKAKYDLYTYTPKGASNPILTTRGAVVAPQPGVTGEGYDGGSRDAANAESIRMMQSEIDKLPANHPDVPVIRREIARLQSQSGMPKSGGIELQSEADKVKTVKQAEADIKPTDSRQNAIASGNYLSRKLEQVLNHPGLESGTGLMSWNPAKFIPGTSVKDFNVLLDQVKGNAFLQAFENLKGGGQITEVEGNKATDAIARLNTAQSTAEFKSALRDFQEVVQGGLSRMRASADRAGAPIDPNNTGSKQQERPQKSYQDYGYKSQAELLNDARNTIMRNPSVKPEVERRLKAMGLSLGGGQ